MYNFRKGFYADVRTERRYTSTIAFQNGILTENKERVTQGAFIRVYDGKMWYYASTESLDEIQSELDALYSLASYNEDIDADPIVKRFETNVDTKYCFAKNSVEAVEKAKKRTLLTDLFALSANYPEVKLSAHYYLDRHSDYTFASSKGASLAYDYQTVGVSSVFMLAQDGKNAAVNSQKSDTCFDGIDPSALKESVEKTLAEGVFFMKNAKDVEPGDYPVVLSPTVAGVFAHESFGHKSESDFMLGDETMKKEWAIGKTVGSPLLSIYETGIPLGSGYVPYDDEGTKAGKTYLIKDGVLAGRLHSAETAAALDENVTGNARAMNTEFEPIVRMTTTVIEGKGTATKDDLIKNIQKGYYIHSFKHGSGMSTFTIAPNLAYEIIDGKIGGPVKISVISGDVFETLGLIDGVSQNEELLSFVTGGCGKMEQYPLPVGFGAPYVSVSKMRVQ